MAKLAPKDPQFGIPVATRIPAELALKFNQNAANSNKTLSRYVSEFIEKAAANENRLKELETLLIKNKETAAINEKQFKALEAQITKERDTSKKAVGRFILEVAKGDKNKATQLIESYNTIIKDERRNNI